MNPKKFFEICKEKGINQSQIQISQSTKFGTSLFHGELDSYTIADSQSIVACGIFNGKMGTASTQKLDKNTFEYLANQIIQSATYVERAGLTDLFKGSEKYHKKTVYCKELAEVPTSDKIALIRKIEEGLKKYDKRIVEVEGVDFSEKVIASEFYNSLGLALKQKSNYFVISAAAVGKNGEETKESYDVVLDTNIKTFDVNAMVKKIGDQIIAKFGGEPCDSGKYPAVLKNDVFADLLGYFLSSTSSEEVQKQSSILIGKLGQKIASSKLTIEEKPLTKNVFFSYFDDEGVATQNKTIVKNGVLQTYLYNRETAAKEGKQSTGNGVWEGGKIGIGFGNVFVKPGKQSFDELISGIEKGVYITELAGLGTGMNARSGDFSCQAQGFMIENGKLTKPLNLITLSGNLLKMLQDLKGFDNRSELLLSAISCSDALIKKMSIGGK